MFSYPIFDVEIVRKVEEKELEWPESGDADDDSGLGCNRAYHDLRGLSWTQARETFALEGELIARMEGAEDSEAEFTAIEEELYDADVHLFGLDMGAASTVVCLSAARCVPFASCNAGSFGGRHQEVYPLVAFYARPQMVDLLLAAAAEASIGMENHGFGCLVAYADDIRKMRSFAKHLIAKKSQFRAVRVQSRTAPRAKPTIAVNSDQYKLPLS